MDTFIITCESTADLPYSYVCSRNIPALLCKFYVNGTEYSDDMGKDPNTLPNFYKMISDGALPSTSQLNDAQYMDFFEPLLLKTNILHIGFGSGMTNSVYNGMSAARELSEKYPDRKIVVVDSLCSSSGYGLLVDCAADLRDQGKSLEEIEEWILKVRNTVQHHFFSTDMSFFRRSGRVSGCAATMATILNICPMMKLNDKGAIIAYDKVRGKKAVIARLLKIMEEHAAGGTEYSGKCFISHSNSIDTANELKRAIEQKFTQIAGDIRINDIGPNIATHTGPGTVALFFWGDERTP